MRRIPAILLLLLINASLITPLTFAGTDTAVAACCRRDGKHHCARMAKAAAAETESGGVRITATGTCPLFGTGKSLPATGAAALPPPRIHAIFAIDGFIAKAPQAEAKRRISLSRAWQKRGPPSLLVHL